MDVKKSTELELISRSITVQEKIKSLQQESAIIDKELFERGTRHNESLTSGNVIK